MEECPDVTLSHLDALTQVRGGPWLWLIDPRRKKGQEKRPCLFLWNVSRYQGIFSLCSLVWASLANLLELS